jgi:hypothetical protein
MRLIKLEIPKSTSAKKMTKKISVVTTVIVYFVNSFRFGHLTFRISSAMLWKNLRTLCMFYLRKDCSIIFTIRITIRITIRNDEQYVSDNAYSIFLFLNADLFSPSKCLHGNFLNHNSHRLVHVFLSF